MISQKNVIKARILLAEAMGLQEEAIELLLPEDKPLWKPPVNRIKELATYKEALWPFPDWNRPLSQIRWITVHHSAGWRATTNMIYWHRLHTRTKRWSRVGYHFGIGMFGPNDPITLVQLNMLKWFTWHDARNRDTLGVCIAGDLRVGHDIRPNPVQVDLFGQLMPWLVPQLPSLEGIVGHSYFQATACQGDMKVWMPDLIAAAAKYGQPIDHLVKYGKVKPVARALSMAMSVMPARPPLNAYDEHHVKREVF